MFTSTVTSKGQVTIPKILRDSLRIQANDRVIFVKREDSLILKPIKGIFELRGSIKTESSPDNQTVREAVKTEIARKIANE